jgi:8-oxo-dGTP pyrophosphatase MutT (NUDIX family)
VTGRRPEPDPATDGTSRWQVMGERSLYESPWVSLRLVDVVHPDGHRYEHHAVRQPAPAVACVVRRRAGDEDEVLLLWRHRLVPDCWGWEVPAGRVEPGESYETAAARETLEETGWTVRDVRHLTGFHPIGGTGDHRFEVCLAEADEQVAGHDPAEADRIQWWPTSQVRELVRSGQVQEGLSVVALLWLLSGLDGPAAPRP